jgi:hypothetical protein
MPMDIAVWLGVLALFVPAALRDRRSGLGVWSKRRVEEWDDAEARAVR